MLRRRSRPANDTGRSSPVRLPRRLLPVELCQQAVDVRQALLQPLRGLEEGLAADGEKLRRTGDELEKIVAGRPMPRQ